ncbi:MAG: hypothetical protein WAT74_17260 [Flavobacteriales bacterium]
MKTRWTRWLVYGFGYALGLLLSVVATRCEAQNLVPNPSFEEYFNCPNDYGESFELRNWFMAITNPDYYNACYTVSPDTCGVPLNFAGFQYPATGNGYIGMITYSNDPPYGFRELIGVKLSTPIVPGSTYYTSFKVSCTNGYPNPDHWTRYAANKLGISIRTDSLLDPFWFPPDNVAQFASDSIVTDTSGWTLLSGSFVSQISAQWLYLGNFFDHASVSVAVIDPDCPDESGYYYFDDVCLSLDPGECPMATSTGNLSGPVRPRVWVAPGSAQINLFGLPPGRISKYELYDALGRTLAQGQITSDGSIALARTDQLVVLRLWDGSGEWHYKLPVLNQNP